MVASGRIFCQLWAFAGWIVVWASVLSTCTVWANEPVEVILLRGAAGRYWPQIDFLKERLHAAGFDTWDPQTANPVHLREMLERRPRYRDPAQPLNIVGYSSGGDNACLLGRQFECGGRRIETLIMVETTLGFAVPASVEYCFNLYESNPGKDWIPIFRGVPVKRRCESTVLWNVDARVDERFACLRKYHHLNFASNPDIHRAIVELLIERRGISEVEEGTWEASAERIQP